MERYYKKLMNTQKTALASLVDSFFLLLGTAAVTFGICYIKLENMLSSCIITFDIAMIMLLLLGKAQDYKIKSFKRRLDDRIRQKLVLEKIVFGGKEPNIKGYAKMQNGFYISDNGKRARLLIAYPSKVLTPFEIAPFIRGGADEIIASCSFDDDCRLLCGRKGIGLYDKDFLLKNTDTQINEE
ncbi:MAG: hypothetical protein IJR47_03845, partial [Clostridia bacterium]|nr:hypothetical protein [Clostridia bacterium]